MPGNETATETTTVNPAASADLSITKIDSADPVTVGDGFNYTVTVTNNGPSTSTGVVMTDVLPASVAFVAAVPSQGSCSGTSPLVCNIGTLNSGASETITINVTALTAGVTTNTATVSSATPDPAAGNDSATEPTTILSAPLLTATKTATLFTDADGNGFTSPGDTIEYTIVIGNAGGAAATGVRFNDTPDANTPLVAGSVTTTAGLVASGNAPGETVVAVNAGTIAGGASVTIHFRAVVANPLPAGVTIVANQGQVSSNELPPAPTDDPSTPAVDDPTTTPVTAQPLLTASKTDALVVDADSSGTVTPGDTIAYTIAIANGGNAAATNAALSDTPDANSPLVAGSVTTSQGTVTSGNAAGDTTVGVTVGAIAAGSTVSITFRATVKSPLPAGVTTIANHGVVTSDQGTKPTDDPRTVTPDDPTVTPVGNPPVASIDLAITKTASPTSIVLGQTITYTITVVNNGPDVATNVVLSDPLAATLDYVTVSTTQGTCSGGQTVQCALGTLAVDASATVTLVVRPNAAGTINNTATASSDGSEAVTANNTDSAAIAVAQAAPIPALSDVGLVGLWLGLAAVALLVMKRKT